MPLYHRLPKRRDRVLHCNLAPLPVRSHDPTHGVDVARTRECG